MVGTLCASAFFIDDGPAKVVDTPQSSPDEHGTDVSWTITLSPSGAGDLVAEEAPHRRLRLRAPDGPQAARRPHPVRSSSTCGFAVLKYGAHSDGLVRREGDELAVPLAETSTLTSQLAPLVHRKLPVVLPQHGAQPPDPHHHHHPPPGYTFAELPPNGEVAGGAPGGPGPAKPGR